MEISFPLSLYLNVIIHECMHLTTMNVLVTVVSISGLWEIQYS